MKFTPVLWLSLRCFILLHDGDHRLHNNEWKYTDHVAMSKAAEWPR